MQKVIIGASVTVLILVLLLSARAFASSLASLNLGASSFAKPAPVLTAPMTFTEESQINASGDSVRIETVSKTTRLCRRERGAETTTGF